MNELYDAEGWVNIDFIMSLPYTFIITIGGRGIGKTYGMLKYLWFNEIPYIYMRRTGSQLDMISTTELHPLAPVARDHKFGYIVDTVAPRISGIYEYKDSVKGKLRGYNMALSLMATVRGFDASQIQVLFYDEYIKESHEKPIRQEFKAFVNAYETINRNRELKGDIPLRVFLASNSDNIDNPILDGMGIITDMLEMQKYGECIREYQDRDMCIINFRNSPISMQKRTTAIGRILETAPHIGGIILDNDFSLRNIKIGSKPKREMRCICSIDMLSIWQHKGDGNIYIMKCSGDPKHKYKRGEVKDMMRTHPKLLDNIHRNRVFYDEYGSYVRMENIIKEG